MQGEAPKHRDDFAEVVDDVDEILAELVDRLADRREQHDPVRRANVLGCFERAIPGVLDEQSMLGPRAAIGDGCSGFRDPRSGAVDHPGAGRVQALDGRKIQDNAFGASDFGHQRRGAGLQGLAGADDPRAGQQQDDPVAGSFFGNGRRSGHQALRPSRNGAHIARPG